MVYLIANGEIKGSVILVKAEDETDSRSRINLREGEKIVGKLTDNEVSVLSSSSFVVISA